MKQKSLFLLLGICVVLFLSACKPSGTQNVIDEATGEYNADAMLKKYCISCHTLDRVVEARYSLEDWTVIIDRMINKGINMQAEEHQFLIDYLAQQYPAEVVVVPTEQATEAPQLPTATALPPTVTVAVPTATTADMAISGDALLERSCVACHTLDRVKQKKATLEQWTTIVNRMVNKGAVLTASEKDILIQYLAETYPN